MQDPLKIKGFTTFSKISKRKFHGIRVYVRNILRIPDEDEELEVVHIIIKYTTPVCNIFGCYLDVESTSDPDKISWIWHKLKWKIDATNHHRKG